MAADTAAVAVRETQPFVIAKLLNENLHTSSYKAIGSGTGLLRALMKMSGKQDDDISKVDTTHAIMVMTSHAVSTQVRNSCKYYGIVSLKDPECLVWGPFSHVWVCFLFSEKARSRS